ncbi:MAG: hypothetical protein M1814_000384 [Vezdaea aestivalis]|nr:MAG: hypothetical protein M1814_000384 [Vezdaea aestivalis]
MSPSPGDEAVPNRNSAQNGSSPVTDPSPPPPTQSASSSSSIPKVPSKTTLNRKPQLSATSAGPSPKPSRESSPARPRTRSLSSSKASSPRRGSQDVSPGRQIPKLGGEGSNQPNVARKLSATSTPALTAPSSSSTTQQGTRPRQLAKEVLDEGGRHWPASPRLKSPPPSASGTSSVGSKAQETLSTSSAPNIVIQSSTPTDALSPLPTPPPAAVSDIDSEEKQLLASGMRTPIRGGSGIPSTLETVQEGSLPSTPAASLKSHLVNALGDSKGEPAVELHTDDTKSKEARHPPESGNESSGTKSDEQARKPSTGPAKPPTISRSSTSLASKTIAALSSRTKPATDPSANKMTVEIETVSSIPQVAVGGNGPADRSAPRSEAGGTIRLKPSSETIRPKKEKKKTVRKAPSLNAGTGGFKNFHNCLSHGYHRDRCASVQSLSASSVASLRSALSADFGTLNALPASPEALNLQNRYGFDYLKSRLTFPKRSASSKADIFEAKVASAVDEADSSDSDETFVYESNPPESHATRNGRYHSRTPSVTSMQSYADHRSGTRSNNPTSEGGQPASGVKKNMKFANPSHTSSGVDADVSDRIDMGRGHAAGSARGNATGVHNQKRINTHGRGARNGHVSLFDADSPFTSKSRNPTAGNSRQSSRPSSPRNIIQRLGGNNKKTGFTTYDLDIEGDDEQTPLMSSPRVNRNRVSRRYGGPRQRQEAHQEQRRVFTRFMACFLITIMVVLILVGALGFIIATTKPLMDVKLCKIDNVLASEQQIILDLVVEAANPNILSVAISDMDVNIFAKSGYVGSDRLRRSRPPGIEQRSWDQRKRKAGKDTSLSGDTKIAYSDGFHFPGDGVDDGTDPPDWWPGRDAETMLLGEIFELDSALVFPGSPLKHKPYKSSGELKLRSPGNKTEIGGSERWDRVLEHRFNLIVRGVLKYQLPFSGRTYSATISGNVTISPDSSVDDDVSSHSEIARCSDMDGSDEIHSPSRRVSFRFDRFF